ncbi:hypothetical protein HGRIS_006822 [Hohenbuehelia grisea]|uniref:PH domain-containing protein n=1 Tax=Hohenbuehelia grisea TaxID=104357 RepID=A0ABR3JAJ8_9AGAR
MEALDSYDISQELYQPISDFIAFALQTLEEGHKIDYRGEPPSWPFEPFPGQPYSAAFERLLEIVERDPSQSLSNIEYTPTRIKSDRKRAFDSDKVRVSRLQSIFRHSKSTVPAGTRKDIWITLAHSNWLSKGGTSKKMSMFSEDRLSVVIWKLMRKPDDLTKNLKFLFQQKVLHLYALSTAQMESISQVPALEYEQHVSSLTNSGLLIIPNASFRLFLEAPNEPIPKIYRNIFSGGGGKWILKDGRGMLTDAHGLAGDNGTFHCSFNDNRRLCRWIEALQSVLDESHSTKVSTSGPGDVVKYTYTSHSLFPITREVVSMPEPIIFPEPHAPSQLLTGVPNFHNLPERRHPQITNIPSGSPPMPEPHIIPQSSPNHVMTRDHPVIHGVTSSMPSSGQTFSSPSSTENTRHTPFESRPHSNSIAANASRTPPSGQLNPPTGRISSQVPPNAPAEASQRSYPIVPSEPPRQISKHVVAIDDPDDPDIEVHIDTRDGRVLKRVKKPWYIRVARRAARLVGIQVPSHWEDESPRTA